MAERYPEKFQGAAPERIDIVYSPSDGEKKDVVSLTSVLDLLLSSHDEEIDDEIRMMTQCVDMELLTPIPVPGPSRAVKTRHDTKLIVLFTVHGPLHAPNSCQQVKSHQLPPQKVSKDSTSEDWETLAPVGTFTRQPHE